MPISNLTGMPVEVASPTNPSLLEKGTKVDHPSPATIMAIEEMVVLATITEDREMVLEVNLEEEVDPNLIKVPLPKSPK